MTEPLVAVCIVVADQLVKAWARSSMVPGESLPVLQGIFHITYVENPGAAFGLFANARWLFIAAGASLLIASLVFYRRIARESAPTRLGAALLLGGAVGNLIDRVRFGMVTDFLDFIVWPVFNIADIAITVGVALVIYELFIGEPREAGG